MEEVGWKSMKRSTKERVQRRVDSGKDEAGWSRRAPRTREQLEGEKYMGGLNPEKSQPWT